jgi:hypothetical protein
LSCHDSHATGGVTNFLVQRDCLECHIQVTGEASVHHLTAKAQGTDSPLGDPGKGDCTPCHGTFVDDFGDNATIPTYDPSLVTPDVNSGTGAPLNSNGDGAGACNYCHDSGTDTATEVAVFNNYDTHHEAGVDKFRNGDYNTFNTCQLCHGNDTPEVPWLSIRECEQCHGMESLHNIQADSNGGGIEVGGELAGYGHVGRDAGPGDSDCWGCHGFGFASAAAPGSGPITPHISDSNKQVIVSGTDTSITLNGSSLTNYSGTTEFVSTFILTSKEGVIVELPTDQINAFSSTIIIPGTTVPGNYLLTAVKDSGAAISNPLPISIKPQIKIKEAILFPSSISCGSDCSGTLIIKGSGFGDTPPAGAEEFLNVMQDGKMLTIVSWTDTRIEATGAMCEDLEITVNGLFGSATK